MGEGKMHTEYQVMHHDVTVLSGGQLDLGEHNDSTEMECGLHNEGLIRRCLFTEATHAILLLSNPEL